MQQSQQEIEVSKAFTNQSGMFDAIDDANSIITWMRERVRREVMKHLKPDADILELNCGTGIDAVFFAIQGHHVLATDNAPGMLEQLDRKIVSQNLQNNVQTLQCSFNNLDNIKEKEFDYVFSNFGGLNCTDDLANVLNNIDRLLKPGGYFTLVIMPVVCPWEIMTVFKGYFKTAFRRFKKQGTNAHLEGVNFRCYYYNPSYIINRLSGRFETVNLQSLSLTVPPPYIEHFKERHPRLFHILEKIENRISHIPPFNSWGDHYMITMQKKAV